MTPSAAIALIGGAFAVACGVPLLTHPRFRRDGDRLFGALVLLTAFTLFVVAGDRLGMVAERRWIGRIDFLCALAAGPLVFLYQRAIASSAGVARRDAVHVLPLVAGGLVFVASALRVIEWELRFAPILAVQICYSILAALAWRHGRMSRHQSAAATRHLAGAVVVIVLAVNLAQLLRSLPVTQDAFAEAVPLATSLSVLGLGAVGFVRGLASTGLADQRGARKYAKSVLSDEWVRDMLDRLHRLMAHDEVFRQADLTLDGLASRLEVSRHQLSQLLNQHLNTTFADYVTTFRVADAKRALLAPANDVFTIDAIAESAGFSSRSAFYSAFRRLTGQTPLGFRASQRSS